MARIRTIKPDFWTDEKIVELSPMARLLFIGLWNFCDDDGRMPYSPRKIKMQIFPSDHTDLSGEFGEIRGESLITLYIVENTEYLQINNFNKHQKIDKRSHSKYPPPPISPDSPRRNGMEGKGMDIHPSRELSTTEHSKDESRLNYSGFTIDPDFEEMGL